MLALCFECGAKKSSALKLCSQCQAIPKTQDEQVLSLCLSLECVTQDTLTRCRKHFKLKNRPPRFKETIVTRATEFLEEQIGASSTKSLEFSSSAFDFRDLVEDEASVVEKTITVHIIGRGPTQDTDDPSASLGKSKRTYHKANWIVGKDIKSEMYESNKDAHGEIHVWYRWINNKWTWMCISSSRFDQLKAVEFGHMSS